MPFPTASNAKKGSPNGLPFSIPERERRTHHSHSIINRVAKPLNLRKISRNDYRDTIKDTIRKNGGQHAVSNLHPAHDRSMVYPCDF